MAARRGIRIAGIALGIAVVVAVGVVGVLFATREDPGAKSVEEAIEELASDTTQPGGAMLAGPAPGVYPAEGEGREAISTPPVAQTDGVVIPVSVERVEGDCWRVTVDYNEAHWQDWRFCPDGDVVVDEGGTTYQRWDFGALTVENETVFVCDPPPLMIDPAAEPGASWDQTCVGTSSQVSGEATSSGPYRFEGRDELTVAGQVVPVRHYRQERTLSGAQSGSTVLDVWFAEADGLPVRMAREVAIDSSSPVGTVAYTESGWWQLTTLTPATAAP